jgi:hypothetical protein
LAIDALDAAMNRLRRLLRPNHFAARYGRTPWLLGLLIVTLLAPGMVAAREPAPTPAPMPLPPGSTTVDSGVVAEAADIPVLAYYYIWFDPRSWSRAKTDYPLLGRYSSDDRRIMQQHIRWAKAAGIDGFIVSWKDTEVLTRRLELLVEVAEEEKFKLAIIYQGLDIKRQPFAVDRIAADLDFFLYLHGDNEVFNIFGRPLVIWSGTWEYSRDDIAEVTESRRNELVILGSERNEGAYRHIADLVDGNAYYWSSVNPDTFPDYPGKLQAMSAAIHEYDGLWIAPAAPGFDAREIGGERVIERNHGAMLRRQMGGALVSNPDAVGVISWNEFSENSQIEPSCTYGAQDLATLAVILGGVAPKGLAECENGVPVRTSVPLAAAVPAAIEEDGAQTDPVPERPKEPSRLTLTIAQQLESDFDSSSPGGTQPGIGGLAVLGLLAGFILVNLAIVVRRARERSLPPPDASHLLQ